MLMATIQLDKGVILGFYYTRLMNEESIRIAIDTKQYICTHSVVKKYPQVILE